MEKESLGFFTSLVKEGSRNSTSSFLLTPYRDGIVLLLGDGLPSTRATTVGNSSLPLLPLAAVGQTPI